jgi:hypothetical protein
VSIATEQLASGRDAPARRWPLVLASTLLAVVVVVLGADRAVTRHEVSALIAAAGDGQATAAYAERRVTATLSYASPQLTSAAVSAQVRASLADLVQDTARDQLPALADARARAADVSVLPWHHRARTARAASLRYLDARIARVRATADDFGALYLPQDRLTELRAEAIDAVVDAGGAEPRIRAALEAVGP